MKKKKSEDYYILLFLGYSCYLISLIFLGIGLLTILDKLGLLTILDNFPIKKFHIPLILGFVASVAGRSLFDKAKKRRWKI